MKRLPSLVALVSLAFAVLAFNSCSSVSPSSGSASGSTSGSNPAAAQGETTRLKLSNKLYRPIVVRLERLGDPGRQRYHCACEVE